MRGSPTSGLRVVAGLGNPGREYLRTPHNMGFEAVDELAQRLGQGWKTKSRFRIEAMEGVMGGLRVFLLKPLTFMNASGDAIGAFLEWRGMGPETLTVLLDDADLPLGRIRIRPAGGSGGHRGLLSVIECLGTEKIERVRIGVGRRAQADLVDHVLGAFTEAEWAVARRAAVRAADAVACRLEEGLEAAMNRFNGRSDEETDTPPDTPAGGGAG